MLGVCEIPAAFGVRLYLTTQIRTVFAARTPEQRCIRCIFKLFLILSVTPAVRRCELHLRQFMVAIFSTTLPTCQAISCGPLVMSLTPGTCFQSLRGNFIVRLCLNIFSASQGVSRLGHCLLCPWDPADLQLGMSLCSDCDPPWLCRSGTRRIFTAVFGKDRCSGQKCCERQYQADSLSMGYTLQLEN